MTTQKAKLCFVVLLVLYIFKYLEYTNMDSGKQRSANFTYSEESLLISLVKKYRDTIENKKSDTGSNKLKHLCWVRIEKEFNGQNSGTFRNSQVLRKKYENIKKRTKKKNK